MGKLTAECKYNCSNLLSQPSASLRFDLGFALSIFRVFVSFSRTDLKCIKWLDWFENVPERYDGELYEYTFCIK